MNNKENALRIIHFDGPEHVTTAPPAHNIAFYGANHEGFEGGGHHLPVGSRWTDIWGVGWHREHDGVMGFPRNNPLADLPHALASYIWPDPDDPRICTPIYSQIDILNPIQATANDLDMLRAQMQDRLALQGGVSSATIVSGPTEAIRAEVAERLWQLGRNGGYFCGPDQGMPWPEPHIQALHDAVDELGTYPLCPVDQQGSEKHES